MRTRFSLNIAKKENICCFRILIETGSLEAAKAVIMDLLAFRADRDRYYYGMDTMFDRHPDLVKRSTESRYGLRLCVL